MPSRQTAAAYLLLLSSAALCRAAQPLLAATLPDCDLRCSALPLPALLAAFDGSVTAYARDLYAPPQAAVGNQALADVLQQALDRFQPDLVLATAENRYLAALARRAVVPGGVFFIEKAPLPAWFGPARLYFDNRGHQSNGTLAGCWPAILQANYEPQEIAAAQSLLQQMAARQQRPEGLALRHQVRQACKPGREILLVALQPADWLSWEGALSTVIDPIGLPARCCAAFPALNVVPTLHRDMAALRPDALRALSTPTGTGCPTRGSPARSVLRPIGVHCRARTASRRAWRPCRSMVCGRSSSSNPRAVTTRTAPTTSTAPRADCGPGSGTC